MPTYEYRCRDCGHTFEIVQRMSDDPLTVCPNCGGELRKVFAPPAISFKGSGFYATDHGKKAKPSGDGKMEGETKGDSKKDDTKKETTTATADGKSGASTSSTAKEEGTS